MGNRRMLHKKISISLQVNRMSIGSQLLFTWMIAHADDEGRLKGDISYVKGTVIPLKNWSLIKVKKCLEEMKKEKLIHWWEQEGEWYIEFIKWTEFQQIRKDRFEASKIPSYPEKNGNQTVTYSQPTDDTSSTKGLPKDNINKESNINISEYNKNTSIADNNFPNDIDIETFEPQNEGEAAALAAYVALEEDNVKSFLTTYYYAYLKGLPTHLFYQFVSEIEQDPNIKNGGAVFNTKVKEYFEKKKKNKDEGR